MTAYSFTKVKDIAADTPYGDMAVIGVFELSAGLADTDTIGNLPVPDGAIITDVTVDLPELDSNGSPTGTFDVGDSGDINRFISAGPMGGSATNYHYTINTVPTSSSGTVSIGRGYQYTADSNIFITVTGTVATAVTSGTVVLTVKYTKDAF